MGKQIEYLKKYYKGNLESAIKRLNNNEPVQYIVGNVNFYGYQFEVNKNVLIPRRETEELVSEVITRSIIFNNPVIIDVGTGSGAIAVTLSKELHTKIYASDISDKALNVAINNNSSNNSLVEFYKGDMLKPYINKNMKVDILVSNPPYISRNEQIEDIVYDNEPHLALFANNNGLEFYEKILKDAKNIMNERFLIAFEIGYKQKDNLISLAKKYFPHAKIEVKKDLSKKDRMFFVYND